MHMTISAKITSKGQITVPKEVREALGVSQGDRVVFETRKDGFVLRREKPDGFEAFKASLDMFSDDFMTDGRDQFAFQDRPPVFPDTPQDD